MTTLPDRAHLGAYCELLASNWLMSRGWWVFRNLSPVGPIDLVAVNSAGERRLIDVKCWRKVGTTPSITDEQARLGVIHLYVHPETGAVSESVSEARSAIYSARD